MQDSKPLSCSQIDTRQTWLVKEGTVKPLSIGWYMCSTEFKYRGQVLALRCAVHSMATAVQGTACAPAVDRGLQSAVVSTVHVVRQVEVRDSLGGGDAAMRGIILTVREDSVWELLCESARDRYLASMLFKCYLEQ